MTRKKTLYILNRIALQVHIMLRKNADFPLTIRGFRGYINARPGGAAGLGWCTWFFAIHHRARLTEAIVML
jgi:hypothetical protein